MLFHTRPRADFSLLFRIEEEKEWRLRRRLRLFDSKPVAGCFTVFTRLRDILCQQTLRRQLVARVEDKLIPGETFTFVLVSDEPVGWNAYGETTCALTVSGSVGYEDEEWVIFLEDLFAGAESLHTVSQKPCEEAAA